MRQRRDLIMEIRVLEYFLAVAREQNITAAAESLHLTQPTLSVQIKALEEELGKPLLVRGKKGSRKVTLTEEGKLLRARAEEILNLVEKTESEISQDAEVAAGEVYIGTGESDTIRYFARAARELQKTCPDIHYHFKSGNAAFVMDQVDNGLVDFGLVFGDVDVKKYNTIPLPVRERWGILMRREDPLSGKKSIAPSDLKNLPLIISAQEDARRELAGWMHVPLSRLHIAATYNLILNAAILTDEGFGYTVGYDRLLDTVLEKGNSSLCFRLLEPELTQKAVIIWKKYQIFSKAADRFLKQLQMELR